LEKGLRPIIPLDATRLFLVSFPTFLGVFLNFLFFFLAVHGPLVSLAALTEGAVLAQDDSLIPGELALRSLHKELQLECQNASFRIQYYYNQRLVLQEQIVKVLDKLHAHYPLA
jgi:hypothetical protein